MESGRQTLKRLGSISSSQLLCCIISFSLAQFVEIKSAPLTKCAKYEIDCPIWYELIFISSGCILHRQTANPLKKMVKWHSCYSCWSDLCRFDTYDVWYQWCCILFRAFHLEKSADCVLCDKLFSIKPFCHWPDIAMHWKIANNEGGKGSYSRVFESHNNYMKEIISNLDRVKNRTFFLKNASLELFLL